MSQHPPTAFERHCDVAVIGASAAGLTAALELGRHRRSVIVVDSGEAGVDPAVRDQVRSYGCEVLAGRVTGVGRAGDGLFLIEMTGGHTIVARRALAAAGPLEGDRRADRDRQVPDVGADGARTAALTSSSLADEDQRISARPSANQSDWDHRYGGERMWSGNPNGTLVREIDGLPPGRALDVGAGEGGDALWLAEQGWAVTASDISPRALGRVEAEARRRGLRVRSLHADANGLAPFGKAAFDLVSAHYASVPRTPDGRGVRNIVDAVAPGGTLLIVSHDLEPMRAPIDLSAQSRPFDPDAYVRVEDFAAVLGNSADWVIQVHEKRLRPAGAATTAQHVHDIVLRASLRAG